MPAAHAQKLAIEAMTARDSAVEVTAAASALREPRWAREGDMHFPSRKRDQGIDQTTSGTKHCSQLGGWIPGLEERSGMPKLLTPLRWMPVLVWAASLCWPLALSAAPVVTDIENYVVSVGKRANYFDGKFLTADDLNSDQDYKRGTDSLLGHPGQVLGDATLTLDDLFGAAGRGSVRLTFDCAISDCISRGEPERPQEPHLEDLIFLDPDEGTWFGRLYLQGVHGIDDGVYDGLSGSYSQFVAVAEPTSSALVGLALVGLYTVRRLRMPGSRGQAAMRLKWTGIIRRV